jgi:hypothetical protein
MNTVPRTPAEHYREAERILNALPRHGLDPAQLVVLEPLAALAHALLAAAPRAARRRERTERHHQRPAGGSPRDRWISGQDDRPDSGNHR